MVAADRVVVGGGIVGWAAALDLLERDPRRRVVVVDDDRDGRATAAGAGIATPFTRRDRGPEWTRLMFEAMRTYAALVPRLRDAGLEPGHEVVGRLLVARDEAEAATLPEVLERASSQVATFGTTGVGRPEQVDATAVAALHPLLAPAAGALLLPDVAQVDGRAVTSALRALARRLGVEERHGRAELVAAGRGVPGVRVDGETVAADAVVVAAGAWTDHLLEPLGLRTGTVPQRGQIVHARNPARAPLPIASTVDETYLLCFGDGRLVLGPTREDDSGFAAAATLGGLHELLDRGRAFAPGVAQAQWLEVRAGVRPISGDGVPTLGRFDGVDGLVVATGLGAHGLTVGPHVGAWAAALADGVAGPVPAALSPQRWVA